MSYSEPRYSVERVDGQKMLVCPDERSAQVLMRRMQFRGKTVSTFEGASVAFSTIEDYNSDTLRFYPAFFVIVTE